MPLSLRTKLLSVTYVFIGPFSRNLFPLLPARPAFRNRLKLNQYSTTIRKMQAIVERMERKSLFVKGIAFIYAFHDIFFCRILTFSMILSAVFHTQPTHHLCILKNFTRQLTVLLLCSHHILLIQYRKKFLRSKVLEKRREN